MSTFFYLHSRLYTAPSAVVPKGSVTVVDAISKNAVTAAFEPFDAKREAPVSAGVVLKKNTAPFVDLEPEYSIVSDSKAYVALQEAIAVRLARIEPRTP